jgi:protein transport protein SEC23
MFFERESLIQPFLYSAVDFNAKIWICPFCFQRNQFPPHYAGMSQTNLPAELLPTVTTIEYVVTRNQPLLPPAFLFVVDTCLRQEEMKAVKDSLLQALELIPPTACVGLITFGTTVNVYELAFSHYTKSYVFKGSGNDVPADDVQRLLNLGQPGPGGKVQPNPNNAFIVPLQVAEMNIQTIFEELQRDPRPVQNDKRSLRSSGVAISVAISLMQYTFGGSGGRIMMFTGGPPTQGPGLVVSEELKEAIRSHHDLNKEQAKHVNKATKFYDECAIRAARNGHAVDVFSCALDQTGLMEMRRLCRETGGLMVLCEGFEHEVFQKSLVKLFDKDEQGHLQMGLNATLEVIPSRELRIAGAIGNMTSLNVKNQHVGETEIGLGGTAAWRACAMDYNSSFGFYFEVVNAHGNPIPKGQNGMIQFLTTYQHPMGQKILRVTTVAHTWADTGSGAGLRALLPGFDQEATAALMARLVVWKHEREDINPIRWLDRHLIQLMHRFGDFRKNDPMSFQTPAEMNVYPQFMFYLRRGPLIQVFNNTPDETVFFRHCLLKETVSNALVMIQPTLDSYTLDNDPVPVLLSATSVNAKNILMLDTFFHIIIHYGSSIAEWRRAGYHMQPEYENLRELLEMPVEDAKELMKDRNPLPMYVECDQNTSQARFLIASLDPDVTHKAQPATTADAQTVFTEDVNLQVFIDFLKKRVVEYEN